MELFLNLREVVREMRVDPSTEDDPVKRMFIYSGSDLTVNIASGSDAGNSLHRQPGHEEIVVVLEGEAEFRVGDQIRHVTRGDIIFVPRGAVHGRVRTLSKLWTALSIYGPAFDRSKKNIEWVNDPERATGC